MCVVPIDSNEKKQKRNVKTKERKITFDSRRILRRKEMEKFQLLC